MTLCNNDWTLDLQEVVGKGRIQVFYFKKGGRSLDDAIKVNLHKHVSFVNKKMTFLLEIWGKCYSLQAFHQPFWELAPQAALQLASYLATHSAVTQR